MVLISLEHGLCPVKHAVLPLRQTAGNIPAGFHFAQFLPRTMTFQIGLIHHIDAVPIAHVIPGRLIGIMASTHSIDVIPAERSHCLFHVFRPNGTACTGIPLMAVNTPDDQTLAVKKHDALFHFKAAEPDFIRNDLHDFPNGVAECQSNMIQLWCFMAPRLYLFESELRATEELPVLLQFQHAVKQPADMAMNAASLRFSTKLQPYVQRAGGVVFQQARL